MSVFTLQVNASGVLPASSQPITVIPAGATPNPLALPVPTPGAAPNYTAYNALNIPSRAAGHSFPDVESGATTVKLTSSVFPIANTACTVDYFEGGSRIGKRVGDVYPIYCYMPFQSSVRIINYDYNTNAVSLRSNIPPIDTMEIGGAMSVVEAGVMYTVCNNGVLRKWNISGAAPVEIVAGVFPKVLQAKRSTWLSMSWDDRWFVVMGNGDGDANKNPLVVFDAVTNTITTRSFSGLDEPKMSRDGRYIWVRHNTGSTIWDAQTNTIGAFLADGVYRGHAAMGRDWISGTDGNSDAAPWRIQLSSLNTTPIFPTPRKSFAWEQAGNNYWVEQPAGTGLGQWFTHQGATGQPDWSGTLVNDELFNYRIGLYTIDGLNQRVLGQHMCRNAGGSNVENYYKGAARPQLSYDGRICIYTSTMGLGSVGNRSDVFLIKLPLG